MMSGFTKKLSIGASGSKYSILLVVLCLDGIRSSE